MHRSRAPSIAPGTFFVAQPWADCITDMPGFNLRQAHLDDPDISGIHQAPVGPAKSNVDSGLNPAGGDKRFGARHVMIDGRKHADEAGFACSIRVSDDRTEPLACP
jgi:hypothetical protein